MPTPTPHIAAQAGEIAKTVLMPGDPLRSEFIAKTYLENPKLVNDIRGVHGYTGTYRGKPVTVMASGMGQPSIGIYSYELYNFYDVDAISRVGSCGAFHPNLHEVVVQYSNPPQSLQTSLSIVLVFFDPLLVLSYCKCLK